MGLGSMGTKLLANKYIELNIQSIEEVTNTFRDERIIEENNYIFQHLIKQSCFFIDDFDINGPLFQCFFLFRSFPVIFNPSSVFNNIFILSNLLRIP